MSELTVDRAKYHSTRYRGLSYQLRASGRRVYYGRVPGRSRVKLDARGEREALAEWGELRGKVARGERLPDRNIRFAPLAEEWFDSKRKLGRSTRDLYRLGLDSVVLPAFGAWKIAAIDTEAIAKLIRKQEAKGRKASTIENYLTPLNGTLQFAVAKRIIPSNPYLLLSNDQRPQDHDDRGEDDSAYEWSDEGLAQLLSAAKRIASQPEARYDYHPLLYVATRTGLRLGEITGLMWKHVDFDGAVILVRQQFTKYGEITGLKTKASRRRVPLAPEDVRVLRELKLASKFSQDDDFVFASRTGTPLSHRNVQRRGFEAARDLAELPTEITFHYLRHAFASLAASRGVPINVLSVVMGHSDVGVTQRVYVHLYGREQAEEAFRQAMAVTSS